MRLEPDPVEFAIHPVIFGGCCLAAATLWLSSFKLIAAACGAAAAMVGAGR